MTSRSPTGFNDGSTMQHMELGAATGFYLFVVAENNGDQLRTAISELRDELQFPGDISVSGMLQVYEVEGIAAVVEPVRVEAFSAESLQSRSEDVEWLQAAVRRHHSVIQALHEQVAILPARFGSVYASASDLELAISTRYPGLLARLAQVKDAAEWAVHVYAETSALQEFAVNEAPEIQRLSEELDTVSPGRAYLLQRTFDKQRREAIRGVETDLAGDVVAALREAAVDFNIDALGVPHKEHPDEVELVQASFLVHRELTGTFLQISAEIDGSRPFWRVECTGPWPPYSFAVLDRDQ